MFTYLYIIKQYKTKDMTRYEQEFYQDIKKISSSLEKLTNQKPILNNSLNLNQIIRDKMETLSQKISTLEEQEREFNLSKFEGRLLDRYNTKIQVYEELLEAAEINFTWTDDKLIFA